MQTLNLLIDQREVCGAAPLEKYLTDCEMKYTAESKVADLSTLQAFLRDRIDIETDSMNAQDDVAGPVLRGPSGGIDQRAAAKQKARDALICSIISQGETIIRKIKSAFQRRNSALPVSEQFAALTGSEIRKLLRARSSAPAAVAAGVAIPNPETWDDLKASLLILITKRRVLLAQLEAAKANLVRVRGMVPDSDVFVSEMPFGVAPCAAVLSGNFDRSKSLLSQHALFLTLQAFRVL
jgi:hypothetical protein